jgi:hypothetical protein
MVAGEPGRNRSMKAGSGMLQRRRQGVNKDAAIRTDDGLAALPRHGMIGETESWANR